MLVYIFKHLPKVFLIGDYLTINLFLIIGQVFFFDDYSHNYKAQFVLINISWFFITSLTKPYKRLNIKESSLHFNALAKSLFILIAFSAIYLWMVSSVRIDYKNIILYFFSVAFAMVTIRLILFLYRKKNRVRLGRRLYSFNTVLIGENELAKSLLSNNDLRRSMGIRGTYACRNTTTKNKYLGEIDQLFNDIESSKINNIIFCDDSIQLDLYLKILDVAEQKMIRVYMVPDFKYVSLAPAHFDVINEMPFLKLIREPLSNPKKQVLKRTFDICFSLFIMLFLLSWLIPVIALIVKLESNESVFFLQKRSGFKNKSFFCIKFRSMTVDKNADIRTAVKNDPRVTKFGAFMRKTSIDELPQFINVFLGDMSVVGPRPHMISQTDMYSKITKKYMTRHIVKPGITGWAQVMGSRGEIFSHRDMEKRIEKDIWYIQNWSFFLDLKIIFLTLYNIVKGDEQAY